MIETKSSDNSNNNNNNQMNDEPTESQTNKKKINNVVIKVDERKIMFGIVCSKNTKLYGIVMSVGWLVWLGNRGARCVCFGMKLIRR